jgi:hypothetical protein
MITIGLFICRNLTIFHIAVEESGTIRSEFCVFYNGPFYRTQRAWCFPRFSHSLLRFIRLVYQIPECISQFCDHLAGPRNGVAASSIKQGRAIRVTHIEQG